MAPVLRTLLTALTIFAVSFAATDDASIAEQDVYTELEVDPSLSCCDALSEVLGEKLHYADTATYDSSVKSYWSAQAMGVKPACIVGATSTEDVSKAVYIMSTLNKKADSHPPHCQFAIRSGGHSPAPGMSGIEGGVTIDLSGINSIEISNDQTLTRIGGGLRWGNVYEVLQAHSLAIPGGRVTDVGVGGLLTGGGISYYSPRLGFVCDNVESYELVGPFGKVLNVSAETDADLFRALKGGSNNFGIVTHFRMRTFQSGDFWGGSIYYLYNHSYAESHFEAFETAAGSAEYDPFAAIIQSVAWTNESAFVVNHVTYTEVPAKNQTPAFLKALVEVQPTLDDTLRTAPLKSFTDELAGLNSHGRRSSMTTLSFRNSAAFMEEFHYMMGNVSSTLTLGVPGLQISLSFQPLPQVLTSRSASTGGNVLGFSPEDGTLVNIVCTVFWEGAEHDQTMNAALEDVFKRGHLKAVEMGVDARQLYLNYAAPWQDVLGGYGPENLEFLRSVSKRHEPNGVFQNAVPGGFKLWATTEDVGSSPAHDEL